MRFEFDPAKSDSNRAKHGIDFVEAQALWDDRTHTIRKARDDGEARWMVVGRIEGRMWSAIVTYRPDTVRIISVRRARPAEEALYEG